LPIITEKDIEIVEPIAKMLRDNTNAKILSNILEWQEKNITGWGERYRLRIFTWYTIIIFIVVGIIRLILIQILLMDFLILLFGYMVMFCFIYLFFICRDYTCGKENIGNKLKKCLEVISMILKPTPLSLSKIVEYRKGICVDYAKLTATLLIKLYHYNQSHNQYDIQILWLEAQQFMPKPISHVATGVRLGNKIYVLDQRLPILEAKTWLCYWKAREATIKSLGG